MHGLHSTGRRTMVACAEKGPVPDLVGYLPQFRDRNIFPADFAAYAAHIHSPRVNRSSGVSCLSWYGCSVLWRCLSADELNRQAQVDVLCTMEYGVSRWDAKTG